MTGRPHQASSLLYLIQCVNTIINHLGSHCSNVLALTCSFTDGTKLAPCLVTLIISFPTKQIKKRISYLLTTILMILSRLWRISYPFSTFTSFFQLICSAIQYPTTIINILCCSVINLIWWKNVPMYYWHMVYYQTETNFPSVPNKIKSLKIKAIFWENSRIQYIIYWRKLKE
jgi:phage-related protein